MCVCMYVGPVRVRAHVCVPAAVGFKLKLGGSLPQSEELEANFSGELHGESNESSKVEATIEDKNSEVLYLPKCLPFPCEDWQ